MVSWLRSKRLCGCLGRRQESVLFLRNATTMIALPALSRLLILTVAVIALAGLGCSSDSDRSHVQGAVSYNGEPVDDGGIGFLPDEGNPSQFKATGQIVDGRYNLDNKRGPFPGKYRVEIYWNKKTGRTITGRSGATKDERRQALPAKYNERTELKVEVKPGNNTLDFDLKN
jgi:hypothetical protein